MMLIASPLVCLCGAEDFDLDERVEVGELAQMFFGADADQGLSSASANGEGRAPPPGKGCGRALVWFTFFCVCIYLFGCLATYATPGRGTAVRAACVPSRPPKGQALSPWEWVASCRASGPCPIRASTTEAVCEGAGLWLLVAGTPWA